jgi:hypothetical protein
VGLYFTIFDWPARHKLSFGLIAALSEQANSSCRASAISPISSEPRHSEMIFLGPATFVFHAFHVGFTSVQEVEATF